MRPTIVSHSWINSIYKQLSPSALSFDHSWLGCWKKTVSTELTESMSKDLKIANLTESNEDVTDLEKDASINIICVKIYWAFWQYFMERAFWVLLKKDTRQTRWSHNRIFFFSQLNKDWCIKSFNTDDIRKAFSQIF